MANDFFEFVEDLEIPSTSNYFRFEEGENVFRILGSFKDKTAIMGFEYWEQRGDKRIPVRLRREKDGSMPIIPDLGVDKWGNPERAKFFWAFPVYSYKDKAVQILEINQTSILKGIQAYLKNEKWGDPRNYDFIVTKGKVKERTTYSITVNPKEKLQDGIMEMYKNMSININALFDGGDPFLEGVNPEDVEL